jgi:SAM-dependent methyltransferase
MMHQNPQLEAVTCLFGHNTPPEKLFDRQDWWLDLPGSFTWQRCPDCDLLFLSPRPTREAIACYYPSQYAAYRPAIADERWAIMRWKRRRNLMGQIDTIARRLRPGRLLDVGCATGNYLAEMAQLGWHGCGVELNEAAANYARNRFGLEVFCGDLLESSWPANHFDVVTLWDVLEHTHNPLATLQEVNRLLVPGGTLAFSLPEVNSKDAELFGSAWIGYDTPRHLYLFPGQSLALLLEQSGFRLLSREYFMGTYHTWVASWRTAVHRRYPPNSWQRKLASFAYLPHWPTLTAPYFNWLNRRGRGSVVTIISQKSHPV